MRLTCAKTPCKSCPYRKDVPSGIWHIGEYQKLPVYDGETFEQVLKGATGIFMCHSEPGKICAGWLGCHDKRHLLALRFKADSLAEEVWTYVSPVPLFASGAEAAEHGMKDFVKPKLKARRMVDRLREKFRREGRTRK
jgi:hypothetical protein